MLDNKNMMLLAEKIADVAKAVFNEKVNSVVIFGSYARNDYDSDSDIDIMIIADIPREDCWKYTTEINKRINDLELQFDVLLSVCVVGLEHYEKYKNVLPFYRNIEKEGIRIAV